ncbi:hypothetical protein FSARC_9615 [Fusarium sarcochroum]|uniref:Uncharacterized protein n=1 Tax=Fusarium sarcochroum TaxID=1208366 RepID=A0A8H4X544_9HYPO|nr:hypothetical protein FSARC_9615 [Fusarium sarcochroum]
MRPIPPPPWLMNYAGKIPSIVTSIRQHPEGVAPTLESIPQLNTSMMKCEPLSSMIRDMQETGFKRWGFVIFRSAYTDESQWKSYIEFFKAAVEDDLKFYEISTLLMPHLEWTIIEDHETLNNASKQEVRERFSQWTAERSVERDGPGAEEPFVEKRPRFQYCIYVDQKCLDTFDQYKAWAESGAEGIMKEVVCVILDKNCKKSGRGSRGFPRVEGCKKEYTGWMYTSVDSISDVYNRLSFEDLADHDYRRPPEVWPSIEFVMPIV